jgi:hypothetical protein
VDPLCGLVLLLVKRMQVDTLMLQLCCRNMHLQSAVKLIF